MSLRNNCYATVWETRPVIKEDGTAAACTDVRLSCSRKNKQTGEYETDFSGFVRFIGDAHKMAAGLKARDRIMLNEIACTNSYSKETKKTYYNFQCFGFTPANSAAVAKPAYDPSIPDDVSAEELPFN